MQNKVDLWHNCIRVLDGPLQLVGLLGETRPRRAGQGRASQSRASQSRPEQGRPEQGRQRSAPLHSGPQANRKDRDKVNEAGMVA